MRILNFADFLFEAASAGEIYAIGAKGEEVKTIQQKLIDLGFLKISAPTGNYQEQTKQAVEAFQKSKGLEVDGIVGPLTSNTLFKKSNSVVSIPDTSLATDTTRVNHNDFRGFKPLAPGQKPKVNQGDAATPAWFQVIPPNIKEMMFPRALSIEDFTNDELVELWKAIQASMKRLGGKVTAGATKYIDWGPEYDRWFDKDQDADLTWDKLIRLSTTDSKFKIATTVGQGSWKIDSNNPNIIHYTDRYNMNKKRQGLARYPEAANIKDSELEKLNLYQKYVYLRDHSKPTLSPYKIIREIAHRSYPIGEVGPPIIIDLDKSKLEINA